MAGSRMYGLTTGVAVILGVLIAQPTACSAATSDSGPVTSFQTPQLGPALTGAASAPGNAVRPITDLRLDPMAASSADPLSNGVALQPDAPGDTPLSTTMVTGALSQGGGLSSLPLVGAATGALPG